MQKIITLLVILVLLIYSCEKDSNYADMTNIVFENKMDTTILIDVDNTASGYVLHPDIKVVIDGRDCNGVPIINQKFHVHIVGNSDENYKIFEGVVKTYNLIK